MAKILFGLGFEAISGTFGGATFQKWRSLNIVRGKPVPSNPMTVRQTRIRSIVSTISRAWRDVLTAGQRIAWEQFAEIFPWFDVFGKSMSLRGISLFLKMNTVLLDHDKPMQITPPPALVPPELTGVIVAVEENQELQIKIPQLSAGLITAQESFVDIWVAGGFTSAVFNQTDPNYILSIATQALPPGRKHQKSDFRHVVYADDTPEPVAPAEPVDNVLSITIPDYSIKNVFARVQRYNKYGRYSVPLILGGYRAS